MAHRGETCWCFLLKLSGQDALNDLVCMREAVRSRYQRGGAKKSTSLDRVHVLAVQKSYDSVIERVDTSRPSISCCTAVLSWSARYRNPKEQIDQTKDKTPAREYSRESRQGATYLGRLFPKEPTCFPSHPLPRPHS